ncbi:interferon regulatory factor 2-like [Clupea harengus]|uniref:Interferon regulatory factor 2-like n=1 Tax=Clupea harengus TaxID=7950 RepID=A0A6P8EHG3_CLUHA|nr:interferon regulatory factor 2-like [Clupea harengus]
MPVDRMLMRPWLEEQINSASINNLVWLNKQKKIFQIPWMHAARHGWELDKDAPLFMNWAIHTGKYHPGVDQPDPKTWKANFRCAMNSLPDIEEVKDKSIKKGSNAFKVYRMLTTSERSMKKEKRKLEKEQNKAKKRKSGDDTSSKGSDGPTPEEEEKVEHEADSTVTIDLHPTVSDDSTDNQLVINEMPDVCAVVEVTTELEEVSDSQVSTKREEPPITSSTIYPRLQVSPISSCGESDAESEYSDEDSKEEWDMRCLSEPRVTCSVVRFPSCKAPSNSTFFNSEKINFKVTSCQEESPMIAYNIRPWWRPHLAIRPVPGRLHSGPQVQPRYSSHKRPQHIQHVASEICPPVHPHTSTQVPTQTKINVRAQTMSHMFSPRGVHICLTKPVHISGPKQVPPCAHILVFLCIVLWHHKIVPTCPHQSDPKPVFTCYTRAGLICSNRVALIGTPKQIPSYLLIPVLMCLHKSVPMSIP